MNENKNPHDVSHNLKNLYATDEKDKQEVYAKMKNKQKKQYKKPAIAAACALLIATLPFTSFGGGIVNTVRQAVSPSGRIVVNEEDEVTIDPEKMPLPDYLKDTGDKAPMKEIAKKLSFNPLVFSDKYNYVESEIFADPGTLSDYVSFTYEKDGKTIHLHERISSPETAYETGGEGKIDEVNVDGVKVIIQGREANFERDGLLVSVSAGGADKDDLIAMVKDLHLLK